jgi:plasmid maintenance system killer protein
LTARDDVAALFVDIDLHLVQTLFRGDNLLAHIQIEVIERVHRIHNLRFNEAAHFEDLRGNEIEVSVELA